MHEAQMLGKVRGPHALVLALLVAFGALDSRKNLGVRDWLEPAKLARLCTRVAAELATV
jgi:hypothetical protein